MPRPLQKMSLLYRLTWPLSSSPSGSSAKWNASDIVNALLQVIAIVLAWMALHQAPTLTEADHEALQHDISTAIEAVQPAAPAVPALPPRTTLITPPASPQADVPTQGNTAPKPKRKRPGKTVGKNKRQKPR